MAKIVHTMLRVLDLERSLAFYDSAFGFTTSYRLDFEAFSLVYLKNEASGHEIELTWNKDRSAPYELGDGYGHVAFVVDDLDATHARFVEHALAPRDIVDFAPDGERVARFFFVADPDGYQIEVLQRHGHFG